MFKLNIVLELMTLTQELNVLLEVGSPKISLFNSEICNFDANGSLSLKSDSINTTCVSHAPKYTESSV